MKHQFAEEITDRNFDCIKYLLTHRSKISYLFGIGHDTVSGLKIITEKYLSEKNPVIFFTTFFDVELTFRYGVFPIRFVYWKKHEIEMMDAIDLLIDTFYHRKLLWLWNGDLRRSIFTAMELPTDKRLNLQGAWK